MTDGAPTLLVLHALRLRSLASADVVADRFGLSPESVGDRLVELERDGLVAHRSGRVAGWRLTATGRSVGEEMLAGELEASGHRDRVAGDYGRFVELNAPFLAVCTDWQVVDGEDGPVVNDHSDPERDAAVLDRLGRLHGAVTPVTDSLAATLARFDGYTARLAAAHGRISAGEHEWITAVGVDSYHTVWFELHEDLLATLGRERSGERT